MFRLHRDRIQEDKPFPQGSLGTIFPYQKTQDDEKWLIRHIFVEDIETVFRLLPGITFSFSCDHPSISSNNGYCIEKATAKDGYDLYVKLPRAKESLEDSLKKRKENNKPYTEIEVLKCLCSLASGLEYLHKKKISHNNLKPSNILLSDQGDVQISDIGDLHGQNSSFNHYNAPEITDKESSSAHDLYKADIWSIGIIMIEAMLQESNIIKLSSMSRSELEEKLKELLKKIEESYGSSIRELISPLVLYEANKRPTAEEVKKLAEKALRQTQDISGVKVQQGFEIVEDQDIKKLELENKRLNEYIEKELRHQKEQYEKQINQLSNELFKSREEKRRLDQQRKEELLKKFLEEVQKAWIGYAIAKMTDQKTLNITPHELPFENYESALAEMTNFSKNTLEKWRSSGFEDPFPALEFDFFGSLFLKDIIVAGMIEGLGRGLGSLSSLSLDFNLREMITNQVLNFLAVIIKSYFQRLTSLKLLFADCGNISDQGLVDLANALTNSIQELRYLDLDFGGTAVKGEGLRSLAAVIERHAKSLLEINLRFYSCEAINTQDVVYLLEVMKGNCQNLNSLKLNFDSTQVDSQVLSELAIVIGSNFKKLQVLHLDFGSCRNITDKGMEELGISIGRYLMKLKELEINFDYCCGISDQSVDDLCLGIGGNLQDLNKISLNFGSCLNLSDEALQSLQRFIGSKMKTLEELEISFSQCLKITDKGVVLLAQAIETNLSNLKTLKLSLDQCELISDEGVEILAKRLGSGRDLQNLFLDFGACNNLGNRGVKALSTSIAKNLKKLENLDLNVETRKVTQKQKVASKKQLSFIKVLDLS